MRSKLFSIIAILFFLTACMLGPKPASLPIATVTRIPTETPYPTSTLADLPTPIPTFTPVVLAADIYQRPETSGWTEMIANDPQNAENYYRRADAIYLSSRAIGSRDVYIAKLNFALQDINMAISLQPNNGDYYYLRLNIYDKLAGTTDFIVDSQYLSKLALDDAYQEFKLGTPFDYYPERTIINELIATDQCDVALSNVKKAIADLPPNDISLGGLLHIRSRVYACLGRLDDALQSVNDSMFNNENMEYKNELKVQYLILLGRYEEALPMLDEQICHCELAGWHHYLRAEIYYHTDKKELVQDELFTGMQKTWGRGGMLAYMEAQLAQDEGRTEEAIQYLQLAEATFSDPIYNSLRWKVQEQLKALGAEPLVLTPSPTYVGTPIP